MEDIGGFLRSEIALAQASMEEQANRNRTPAPRYKVGDQVWLSTANIKTQRPSKKLDYKQIGPYRVIEKVGPTSYRLELLKSIKIHSVFHSSLLRLYREDLLPNQRLPPAPPVEIKGEQEWEVKEILDSRWHYGRLQYKARWAGYKADETWYNTDVF